MAEKENRCWPGYEPVKGKPAGSQGSCKPKAESKSTPSEKNFKSKRRKQLDNWEASHKDSPKQSAQHLSAPGAKKKTAKPAASKSTRKSTAASTKHKAAPKAKKSSHTAAKKTTSKRRSTSKRTAAKSS